MIVQYLKLIFENCTNVHKKFEHFFRNELIEVNVLLRFLYSLMAKWLKLLTFVIISVFFQRGQVAPDAWKWGPFSMSMS
jgi:hypothetical protein